MDIIKMSNRGASKVLLEIYGKDGRSNEVTILGSEAYDLYNHAENCLKGDSPKIATRYLSDGVVVEVQKRSAWIRTPDGSDWQVPTRTLIRELSKVIY